MIRKLIDAAQLIHTMRFSTCFVKDGQVYVPLREVRRAIIDAPTVDEGRETDVLQDR